MFFEIIKAIFIINIVVSGLAPPTISGSNNGKGNTNSVSRLPMGASKDCDDGKTNLTVDWDGSKDDYTCSEEWIPTDIERFPFSYCIDIPPKYQAKHYCMRDIIIYTDNVTVIGGHRPVWPLYGKYTYVPKQRWLHSLEHGAIVMLHHPCADPSEVDKLESLVKGCLRRYIITPFKLVEPTYPLALLSWGCRLSMSYVDPVAVQKFIINHALKGAEQLPKDGVYDYYLLEKSEVVPYSDFNDSNLCPNFGRD